MTPASISELKANLSRYVNEARRGGEVQILDRGMRSQDWSPPLPEMIPRRSTGSSVEN